MDKINKIILNITVRDKVATYDSGQPPITCDNDDYRIRFDFDEKWNSYAKKVAHFVSNGEFIDAEFNGNEVDVPVQVNTVKLEVGVYIDGVIRTTTSAAIPCRLSALSNEATPSLENDGRYLNEAREVLKECEEIKNELDYAFWNQTDVLDVDILPTVDIREDCIYRLQKAHGVIWFIENTGGVDDGESALQAILHYVDTLPDVGLPYDPATTPLNVYKQKGDDKVYCYINGKWEEVDARFQIVHSYEEVAGARYAIAFVPERTECDLYIADKSDPFNVRWAHLNKKAVSNVTTLPMDDIDEEGFYKTSENFASTYIKRADGSTEVDAFSGIPVTFHVVDELPTHGELAVDNAESPTRFVGYYCRADKKAYVYYDSGEGGYLWIPLQEFLVSINPNATWKEIQSVDEVTDIDVLYIRLNKNAIFHYDGEWHELVDKAELDGALDGKLDKVTTKGDRWRLYAINAYGEQVLSALDEFAKPYTIANRGADSTFEVGEPTQKKHPVTLGYANEHYVPKVTPPTSGAWGAYYTKSDGSTGVMPLTNTAVSDTIPIRHAGGAVVVGEPKANNHAATKKYVDNAIRNAGGGFTVIDWGQDVVGMEYRLEENKKYLVRCVHIEPNEDEYLFLGHDYDEVIVDERLNNFITVSRLNYTEDEGYWDGVKIEIKDIPEFEVAFEIYAPPSNLYIRLYIDYLRI